MTNNTIERHRATLEKIAELDIELAEDARVLLDEVEAVAQ